MPADGADFVAHALLVDLLFGHLGFGQNLVDHDRFGLGLLQLLDQSGVLQQVVFLAQLLQKFVFQFLLLLFVARHDLHVFLPSALQLGVLEVDDSVEQLLLESVEGDALVDDHCRGEQLGGLLGVADFGDHLLHTTYFSDRLSSRFSTEWI